MSYQVRVGTFNVGQGWSDYSFMVSSDPSEESKLREKLGGCAEQDLPIKGKEIYERVEQVVAEKLSRELDVICLQEVKDLNRSFIQTLQDQGFTIHCLQRKEPAESGIDCAVALRTSLFEDEVTDISILSESHPDPKKPYGQEITGVVAKIKQANFTMAFSSIHVWGSQLYPKDYKKKQYTQMDADNRKYALTYTREAVDKMSQVEADCKIIAGDINNNLENYRATFDLVKQRNYQILEPNEATNVNKLAEYCNYKFRKLDYIFASIHPSLIKNFARAFSAIFVNRRFVHVKQAEVLEGFDFTMDNNCSDHKPVRTVITIETKISKFSWLGRLFGFSS